MDSARAGQSHDSTWSNRSPTARAIYATLGTIVLVLGIAGYILPGLPGTPLLLVAAWLFSMSNERLYRWMTTNRWFGQTVADYREGLGIPRRVKAVAITSMSLVVPLSVAFGPGGWIFRSTIVGTAIVGVVFILTRPTRELAFDTV